MRGFLPGEYERGKDEVGGSSAVKGRVGGFDEGGMGCGTVGEWDGADGVVGWRAGLMC